MGCRTFWSRMARRAHRCLGRVPRWRARAGNGTSPPRHLRRRLRSVARCRLPATGGVVPPTSARLPRRWHAGAVLPRQQKRWAAALREADTDVVMEQREGEHGGAFWAEELPLMVAWAFGD